ncbi:ABC transporter ATP-binding protein [Macrococcoides caseolyticum]|uniref:ABC transporter ATP-binding protein n=1 Tax=Macrococcoides caseolyticum TaxID=69966 RepID=UPI001F39CFDC|nr:ABC transporter ATP-binding protein [Macrococcus caseolyticus]MCE4957210.1 ABC transporter ATP-binding protein [Macrococcus caseolyticus]
MTKHVIEISNLKFKQNKFVLDIPSLQIPKGYITGLIGENGAGKTTLIYQLLNLNTPDSGAIKIFDQTYFEDRAGILSKIGIVFSENHFPEWMNAKKLETIMKMYFEQWDSSAYYNYLDRFEVPVKKKIKHLSQGMKVKLSLATALSHHSKLLILDESTSNLDPTFRVELLKIFQDLMLDEEMTIVFSTHITSDLESIADYIAYIEKGKLLMMDEKDVILDEYKIVRGPAYILDDEINGLLVGTEYFEDSFTALTKEAQVMEELFGNEVSIRKVNIDELMYFKKRERVQHDQSVEVVSAL